MADNVCNAILSVGDDFGDNSSTFQCRLPLGHEGMHIEEYESFERKRIIMWEGDDRNTCCRCGKKTQDYNQCRYYGHSWSQRWINLIGCISQLKRQCLLENWDGYNACPANEQSYNYMYKFLFMLPSSFPQPELSVTPSGDFSADWYIGSYVFSVIVSSQGILHFAGLYDSDKVTGQEQLSDVFPKAIIGCLNRLLGQTEDTLPIADYVCPLHQFDGQEGQPAIVCNQCAGRERHIWYCCPQCEQATEKINKKNHLEYGPMMDNDEFGMR